MTDGATINVDLRGLQDALDKLSIEDYNKAIRMGLSKSIVVVEAETKPETPVDMGLLRQGFRSKFLGYTAILSNIREYAEFVHEGTGKYARGWGGRATARIYRASNGNFYRTNGQRPNPFMERGATNAEDKVRQVFSNSVASFYSKN